jgi:hypothetical protein
VTKYALNKHIKEELRQKLHCGICDETFDKNCELEAHMEVHAKQKEHECNQCGKLFYLKWRLKKHMEMHESKHVRKCHYFNNGLICPFDDIGCMFLHKESDICSFGSRCWKKLCPDKHIHTSPSTKYGIADTIAEDDANLVVKESLDEPINGDDDNRKVNTNDNKAIIDDVMTIEVDIKDKQGANNSDNTKANCVVCKLKLHGRKKFKCDECELDVCYGCHKKTFITQEWFMCLVCQ